MPQRRALVPWLVRVALTTSLLSAPGLAYALGLGQLTLHSGLDEPLNADITLTTDNPDELKTLHAGLAPRSEFDAAGVDWMPLLASIKYTVVKQASGAYVLHLSSDQPIGEPFLHFLLEADWTGGHLIREYTALLDPPYMVAAKPAPVQVPQIAAAPPSPPATAIEQPGADAEIAAAQAGTAQAMAPASMTTATGSAPAGTVANVAPAAASIPATSAAPTEAAPQDELLGPPMSETEVAEATPPAAHAAPASTPTPSPRSDFDWAKARSYGPVKPGDTLWKIADRVRADKSISVEQVMVALLKSNHADFAQSNVNNLKVGRILALPTRAQVESTSREAAAKEFHAQYDVWQEYKLRAAAARRAIKVADAGGKTSAKGAIATQPLAKPTASPAAGKDDLLHIVRDNLGDKTPGKAGAGNAAATQSGQQQQLGNKVALLDEQLTSSQLENNELRQRVALLEKQLESAKRLVEIENSEFAAAQGRAAAKPGVPAATKPPAPTVATKPPASSHPAAPVKPVVRPRPIPHPVVVPPTEDTSLLGFVDGLLDDPTTLALFGGLLVIAGGVFFIYYRRRRRSIAEFEESILSGGGLNSETPTAPSGQSGSEVSLLSEFSQGGMGNIHTDEVDPIAEAEVYLAYGRDEQAEEILKEAVVKDPTRHELRLKLLEIYQQRNDLPAFETVAEELYAALEGKGGKVWDRVEEMGRKMNPKNPLFRGGAARPASAEPFKMAAPMPAQAATAGLSPAPVPAPAERAAQPDTISFDLDAAAPAPMSAPAEVTFDLDVAPTTTPVDSSVAYSLDFPSSSSPATAPEAASLDFEPMSASEPEAPVALALDSADLGTIEFEATTDAGQPDLTLDTMPSGGAAEVEWNLETDSSAVADIAFEPEADTDAVSEIAFEATAEPEAEASIEGLVSSDEIATKLDLAKAYIDMGDAEGARSILNEVAAEGDELQKKQAAELVAQIA